RPLVARYMAKTPVMMATKIGTQTRAAEILSMRLVMVAMMIASRAAAAIAPSTGEITQLAAMAPIIGQLTIPKPAEAMPAPTTPPTTACVVETGAPIKVARFTHSAEASRAAIITMMKVEVSISGVVSR